MVWSIVFNLFNYLISFFCDRTPSIFPLISFEISGNLKQEKKDLPFVTYKESQVIIVIISMAS